MVDMLKHDEPARGTREGHLARWAAGTAEWMAGATNAALCRK